MVAQPPFSMTDHRFHDETLLNSTNFAGASAWCWNFSTQIGASTATTAVSARWVAMRSAVPPSVHPSDENPTTVNTTAPATAPHTAGFTPGWIFISSPWLGEGTSRISNQPGTNSPRRAGEERLGNYSDDAGPARLSISATVLADQAVSRPVAPEAGKDTHRSIEALSERLLGASGRSPTNKLSIVKQRVRVHGRRLSWLLGWHRSVDRSVLGCVLRASAGVAERRRAGV